MSRQPASGLVAGRPPRAQLLVAIAVAMMSGLSLLLIGALAVQIAPDLGLAESSLGLGASVFFLASTSLSVPAGRLIDRVGPNTGLRISCALATASLIGIGVFAREVVVLCACLALAGAGNAVCQPATGVYLSRTVPANRLGLAFGLRQATIPFGTLLGGLAVPVVALTVGWRWAFIGAACLAATAFISIRSTRSGPEPQDAVRVRPAAPPQATWMPRSVLVLLSVGAGLGAASVSGLGTFLTVSAVRSGLDPSHAGLFVGLCSIMGIVSRISIGALADRRHGRHLGWVACLQFSGLAGFGLLSTGLRPLVVLGGLITYSLSWAWPGLFHFFVVHSNARSPGAAVGIVQSGTFAGGVLGPLSFGFVAQHYSHSAAWTLSATLSVLAAGTMVLGGKLARRS